MNESSAPAVLSIGAVLGDSDQANRRWKESISQVGLDVRDAARASQTACGLRINVVFFTPGKYNTDPFDGVRTGRFSKKDAHLMVQAAVPVGEVNNHRVVLLQLISDAIDEAEVFARRRGIVESLDDIRDIAERVAAG